MPTVATNESIHSMLSTQSTTAIKRVKQQAHKELEEVTKSHALVLKENATMMDKKDDQIADLEAQIQALFKLQSSLEANSWKVGNEGS